MLKSFIELTNWKFSETPKAYGSFHLVWLIAGLLLAMGVAILLRKSSEKTNKIVLLSCGIFLAITEIYKQIFYIYVECIYTGEYRWGILSWQLCSIPMYLCLFVPFLKEGKVKQALYDFMASYGLLGGFIALFEPSGLLHEWVMMTLHALIWHIMLVFIGFYLIVSNRAARKIKDFPLAIAVYYSCALIALILDLSLDKVSHGQINMFFIGSCGPQIMIFQDVFEKAGRVVSTIFFTSMLSLGAFIMFIIGWSSHLLFYKMEKKSK